MRYTREDPGATRIATFDIETTHYEPELGEVVSIGVAHHERGTPADEVAYHLVHRDGRGEAETIKRGVTTLVELQPDVLVSYNGEAFDLDFLRQRLLRLNESSDTLSVPSKMHIDLFIERQREAARQDMKWPKLEECLESYGITPATTIWNGAEVTNTRFGKELGPAYLDAVLTGDEMEQKGLCSVIDHYLTTDLEANLALYYSDIGEPFEPIHLGSERAFPVV